jgi:hypothetical protein
VAKCITFVSPGRLCGLDRRQLPLIGAPDYAQEARP